MDVARKLDAEIRYGFQTFSDLVGEIDCDAQPGGHLWIAHRQKKMDFLARETEVMRKHFGYDARMLSAEELRRDWCDDHDAQGAQHESEGISVHPLKLAYGYLRLARAAGLAADDRGDAAREALAEGLHDRLVQREDDGLLAGLEHLLGQLQCRRDLGERQIGRAHV